MSIPAGRTEYVTTLLVKADNVTEDPESFILQLLNPSDRVTFALSMATVNIVDLDGIYIAIIKAYAVHYRFTDLGLKL